MDRLRASEIYADGMLRLIAIESVRYRSGKSAGLYHLHASLEPAALVVCTADGNRLVNLAMADSSLEDMERKVPALAAMLDRP